MQILLAEQDGSRCFQPAYDLGVLGRNAIFEDRAGESRSYACRIDIVFEFERDARLLSPATAIQGAWQVGTGPAIRIVPAKENRVEELVVRVTSLTRTKAFLQANGLLAAGTAADVMLDPSRAFGIKMRFVE